MVFKGNVLHVTEAKNCITCNLPALNIEKLEKCELYFCSPDCQTFFWEELYWFFEEEETFSDVELYQLITNHSKEQK